MWLQLLTHLLKLKSLKFEPDNNLTCPAHKVANENEGFVWVLGLKTFKKKLKLIKIEKWFESCF